MKTKQVINLLRYYLIFSYDEFKYFNMEYIVEKYFKFFKEKPNNINVKEFYLTIKNDFSKKFKIDYNMELWNINNDDENFDIYFFTYYLIVMVNYNSEYIRDIESGNKTNILNKIIKNYKIFFKDFDSIFDDDKGYLIHQVLRNEIDEYFETNKRLFSLLRIKENIIRNKNI